MVDPKMIIGGIPLEKLLEVYYKDLGRTERNRETSKNNPCK
jgi:hypothetical protein